MMHVQRFSPRMEGGGNTLAHALDGEFHPSKG